MNLSESLRIATSVKTIIVQRNSTLAVRKFFDPTYTKLAGILAQALGFSYQLLTPEDGEIGRELSNGSWTGIIGMIQRNEADIAVSGLSITPQRANVVKFSYPFQRSRITFATRKEEYRNEFTTFLGPYSSKVWMIIIVCLIIMPFVRTMLFRGKYCLKENIWITYGTFISQTLRIHPTKIGDYVMMFFWIMAITILGFCYKAVLLSFLTFLPSEDIRTIPQLANAVAEEKYQSTTYPGTLIGAVLERSRDSNIGIIGKNLQKNNGSNDIFAVLSDSKSEKKPAFVGSENHLNLLKVKYVVSDDELMSVLVAIPTRKDFCCNSHLDRIISYIWASGLYRKLLADESFMTSLKKLFQAPENLEKHTERQLSVGDLKGVFIILILGYVLSILIFILEVVIDRFKRSTTFFRKHHKYDSKSLKYYN